MKKISLILCFLVNFLTIMAQTLHVVPTDPKIQYAGRMDFSNPSAPSFSIPSSSILVRFSGTGLSATFTSSGTSYLYVIVDGQADPYNRTVLTLAGRNVTYTLAENLPNGQHTVQVVKLNEYDTQITFLGMAITGYGLTEPPARAPLKMEFYGDSNPSGWSAWDIRDEGHANLSGGYFTYPGLTARMLNAELSNFSAGGHGVTDLTRKLDMKDVYDRIHIAGGGKTSNKWNFHDNYWHFTPDVVVINLGANDYYAGATKELIMGSWNQFVSTLRGHYPKAHIVMANSYGWAFNEPADYVGEFVQARHTKGDTNISFVRFPWLWSDYHAVINEHAGFANILATHIAAQLNLSAPNLSSLASLGKDGNVGNGSFENSLLPGYADGWRPFASWSYPELVTDSALACHGERCLKCTKPSGVMQANQAAEGDLFELSVWIKATTGSIGRLKYEFRGQGQNIISFDQVDVSTNGDWQQVALTTHAAPTGTWQINVILEGVDGTIYFDDASMNKISPLSLLMHVALLPENTSETKGVRIFPNPVSFVLHIEAPGMDSRQYTVFDGKGTKCLNGKGSMVNVNHLPAGIYFIAIDGYPQALRFTKQ